MATVPVPLAKRLGIQPGSAVLMLGDADCPELREALGHAGSLRSADGREIGLVLLRAATPLELESGLGRCWERIEGGCPVWAIYPKGKRSTLGETAVRAKMRGLGLIDVKIASVPETLTGLRFVRRKG